ncbi:hypothetical protein PInf_004970 [Phytophthora infestans]|nr:hypothetical protein PInf_004970 [Phytophthora infestans]
MVLFPLLLMLLATASAPSEAKCVMTQTCVNPDNEPDYDKCIPEAHKDLQNRMLSVVATALPLPTVVAKANVSAAHVYAAETAWLRVLTAITMAENFKLVASVFGKNSAGGCDACAANLMSLWCGLVCSPEQDQFMQMAHEWPSNNYRPDPMTGKEKVKVLELNVSLAKDMTVQSLTPARTRLWRPWRPQ